MKRFTQRLRGGAPRRIPVLVGAGALDALVDDATRDFSGRLVLLVTDTNVGPLHGDALGGRLRERGLHVVPFALPAGEAAKTRETKARLEDSWLAAGADRSSVVVALGGGTVGDLAGFAASTWHRGVPFVQAPTTVLAMADAALGGKTAVDLPGGKNLVGTFHQPLAVYADVATLATLPDDDYRDGFAEIVKAGVIADATLFSRVERDAARLVRREPAALERAIAAGLRVKARIVSADERESGSRAALNFGHTIAHALEAASSYRIPHGSAVAIGMAVEAGIARERRGFPARDEARLRAVLAALGLSVAVPAGLDLDAVVSAARRDKKSRAGTIRFSLPYEVGAMGSHERFDVGLTGAEVRDALSRH